MSSLNIVVRLVIAVLLGGMIGWERESSARPAGLRTHILVCVGATLITIVSIEGFPGSDPGRVAAQIVSGIGFLGAGTIMREGLTVKGLTTAASLWVIAGVGMAVGTQHYLGAGLTTALVFCALSLLRITEKNVIGSAERKKFVVGAKNQPGLLGLVGTTLGEYGIDIESVQLKSMEEKITIELIVKLPARVDLGEVVERLRQVETVTSLEVF